MSNSTIGSGNAFAARKPSNANGRIFSTEKPAEWPTQVKTPLFSGGPGQLMKRLVSLDTLLGRAATEPSTLTLWVSLGDTATCIVRPGESIVANDQLMYLLNLMQERHLKAADGGNDSQPVARSLDSDRPLLSVEQASEAASAADRARLSLSANASMPEPEPPQPQAFKPLSTTGRSGIPGFPGGTTAAVLQLLPGGPTAVEPPTMPVGAVPNLDNFFAASARASGAPPMGFAPTQRRAGGFLMPGGLAPPAAAGTPLLLMGAGGVPSLPVAPTEILPGIAGGVSLAHIQQSAPLPHPGVNVAAAGVRMPLPLGLAQVPGTHPIRQIGTALVPIVTQQRGMPCHPSLVQQPLSREDELPDASKESWVEGSERLKMNPPRARTVPKEWKDKVSPQYAMELIEKYGGVNVLQDERNKKISWRKVALVIAL